MLGTIVVICSRGEAYERMAEAWLLSWRLQHRPGYKLVLLYGGGCGVPQVEQLCAPDAYAVTYQTPETLIPGVLDKTVAYLRGHGDADGWVFRTNLSSHVNLDGLASEMGALRICGVLGFSPGKDHLCGAGLGLSVDAVALLKRSEHVLDRDLIDDLAISQVLFAAGCQVTWTGRLDRVYPDGIVCHNRCLQEQYHVRVKTKDRLGDADVLIQLAVKGIGMAESW